MARVHRPPPPVPTIEHEEIGEEIEDNYGVWDENEFDDDQEIYENTDDPKGEDDDDYEQPGEEDDDDYEHPDDPEPARPAVRPLPSPAPPAIPPIPPRPGFRPLPSPASLRPEPTRVVGTSPRASPVPQVPVEDDEETYEIVDTPQSPPIDDGEVYEEVDKPMPSRPGNAPPFNNSARPVPMPGGGLKTHPSLPDFRMNAVQTKSKQPEIKRANLPNFPRRDLPLPPPAKPIPLGKVTPFKRPSPQPSPPPPPPPEEPEMVEMYTGSEEFYTERHDSPPPPFRGGLAKNSNKPLPRPPSECDDDDDDGVADEFYTEVPETKPYPWKATADRPIPPLPQQQPAPSQATSLSSSGRFFPVEKLQAGLARMAENRKPKEPEEAFEVPSGNMFLNAKSQLKPVNRVESLNTPEKQRLPTVKRAESDNVKRVEPADKRKVSKISEMKNNVESDEDRPEQPGINLSPMFPRKDVGGNRTQPVATTKPTRPVPAETPTKRPVPSDTPVKKFAGPKPGTNDTFSPPVPRVSPFRNPREDANSKEKPAPVNDKRALPKPPTDELGGLYSYGWYFSAIERSGAESKVLGMTTDGAFLVRKSQRGGESNPYTLTLLYKGVIYNLHIRRRPDKKYALGTEKPDEHVFSSVGDLISFHRNNPIEVIGKNTTPGKVVLKASPNK